MQTLQAALAPRIAPVVLANITTRHPYHEAHLYREAGQPFDPALAHPAFCNSFDWHSSVHSHWTAIELLEHFARFDEMPDDARSLEQAAQINLTPENLAAEARYLAANPTYERPYGWAWALRLAAAADTSRLESLQSPRAPLRRLAELITGHAVDWLRHLPGPIRHGVHGNTAFALVLMREAAATLDFRELHAATAAFAQTWFPQDHDYPQAWERSGNDFLSPGLAEADLMRLVLPGDRFAQWWERFVPDVGLASPIAGVVAVPKVSDGAIAHLHGLNLSRAGMLARIASVLKAQPSEKPTLDVSIRLLKCAESLYRAAVDEAVHGDYLSTHWLPTFAWDAATSIDRARQALAS